MTTRYSHDASSRRWWTNPDFYAALILIAAGLIFFADALFSSKNFFYRDILNFHYPLRKVLVDCLARREFPLWNPGVYLGQPMLANPNYMTFYPTNLLHFLFSFNYAFKLHFILHPIAGGLGFYFLARRLELRWVPALAGALAYEFSGAVLSFLNLYNIIPAVALVPWIGWAFYGAVQKHICRRTVGFGILFALQLIAFEPLIFQCDLLLLAALAVAWVWGHENRRMALRRTAIVLGAGGLLAAGLAAVQILPTLELLPLSARGSGMGLDVASQWSMHPLDLLNTIIPNFFGYPFTIDVSTYWGELFHESTAGYMASFFLGSVTLMLFSLSFFSRRTKLRTTLLVFLAISVILGLGKFTPVYPWLYTHVPFFNLGRYPSKFFLLASLLVSMLATLGLETALDAGTDKKLHSKINLACIAGAAIGACVIGISLYCHMNPGQLESMIRAGTSRTLVETKNIPAIAAGLSNSARSSGAFLLLSSLIVLMRRRTKRIALLGGLLTLLIPFELIPQNLGLAPLISDVDMSFIPDVNQYMIRQKPQSLGRAVSPNIMTVQPTGFTLLAPNRSSAWMVLFHRRSGQGFDGIRNGIQYSIDRSIDNLNTRESEQLVQSCLNLPPKNRLDLLANLNSPMVMHLGQLEDSRAEFMLRIDTHSSLDYSLYRLKDALPRAYFATHITHAASENEARNRLLEATTELHDSVILESASRLQQPEVSRGGQVKITRYENSRVQCRVQANSEGYLVLLDSYYPGWHATVDGREADILRANYAFRAVFIPIGKHIVEFTFKPRSFYVGLALTLATCLVAFILGLWMWVRPPS